MSEAWKQHSKALEVLLADGALCILFDAGMPTSFPTMRSAVTPLSLGGSATSSSNVAMDTWDADCSPLPDNTEEWDEDCEDRNIPGLPNTVSTIGSILRDIDRGYVTRDGMATEETDGEPFSWYDEHLEDAVITEEESAEDDNIVNTGNNDNDSDDDDDSLPDLKYADATDNNNIVDGTPVPPPKKEKKRMPERKYVSFTRCLGKVDQRQIPVQGMC